VRELASSVAGQSALRRYRPIRNRWRKALSGQGKELTRVYVVAVRRRRAKRIREYEVERSPSCCRNRRPSPMTIRTRVVEHRPISREPAEIDHDRLVDSTMLMCSTRSSSSAASVTEPARGDDEHASWRPTLLRASIGSAKKNGQAVAVALSVDDVHQSAVSA